MGAVKGVVLDESSLFVDDADGTPCLRPGSASLLRRLCYSNLHVGICHHNDVSHEKATLITGVTSNHSLDCISMSGLHEEEPLNKFLRVWNCAEQMSLYITSRTYEPFLLELKSKGWRIVHVGTDNNIGTNGGFFSINKLEELPFAICNLNKMLMHDKSVLVGYVMKPSREEDFAKRGTFPMYPTQNGLLFVPLTLELPLMPQIKQVDVLLHKATDEIISIDTSLEFSKGISFSQGMSELKSRSIDYIPDCCVIDPLKNIYPLLDRHKIQEVLSQLDGLNIKGHCRLRAPLFLKVDNFDNSSLKNQFSEAKLSFPVIVKPQVACGVADAHNMALVFGFENFKDLCVPLPAIIQEYIDHGSQLHKFYALGDKIFHAAKKSVPNASRLLSSLEKSGSSPLIFNSLKSLPVAAEEEPPADCVKSNEHSLDLELVGRAAESLRKFLGLTVFGFDVVIQEGSGDHVIVDLNYLPSFKEIPDSDAIPAFWDAIKSSFESWKASRTNSS